MADILDRRIITNFGLVTLLDEEGPEAEREPRWSGHRLTTTTDDRDREAVEWARHSIPS
jgi:hypothetical protein